VIPDKSGLSPLLPSPLSRNGIEAQADDHNSQAAPPPMTRRGRARASRVSSARNRGQDTAARVKEVLATRGLTLADVSRESRTRYDGKTAYRIPHHFYADLENPGFSPRMEQVLAFSVISNYRLVDWLALFGFRLDDLASLAASVASQRTALLDTAIYDDRARITWFQSKAHAGPPPPIAPLGLLLEVTAPQPLQAFLPIRPSPFLYAKVGRQDALAYPDLLPGSIVRADTRVRPKHLGGTSAAPSQSLYLVEHGRGLVCSRLHFSKRDFITLRSTELGYAEVELELNREARILGKLDLEFRFLANPPLPEVARDLARFWKPRPLPLPSQGHGFPELTAEGRRRTGLSLREASALTRHIAGALGDERYFCARGTLAVCEANDVPPRHIQKILALCAIYHLPFDAMLAAGWNSIGLGREPIPRVILERQASPARNASDRPDREAVPTGFLAGLLREFEEIPFFLRNSLATLTGLDDLSPRDIVWLGGTRRSLHPYLATAVLAAVNRKQVRPPTIEKGRLWEQPLYLLLRRDGSYLCTRCTLEEKELVVHPFADGFDRPLRLHKGVDAEVIGKIVAVLRRL